MEEERNLEQFVEEYRSSVQANGGIERRSDLSKPVWSYNGQEYVFGNTITVNTDNSGSSLSLGEMWTPSGTTATWSTSNFTGNVISSVIVSKSTTGGTWGEVQLRLKANSTGQDRSGSCRIKLSGSSEYFTLVVNQGESITPPVTTYLIRFLRESISQGGGYDTIKSQSLEMGGMPTPPTVTGPPQGKVFAGWNPTVHAVTGAQDYYVVWADDVPETGPSEWALKVNDTEYYINSIIDISLPAEGGTTVIGQSWIPSESTATSTWSYEHVGSVVNSLSFLSGKGEWKDITLTYTGNRTNQTRSDVIKVYDAYRPSTSSAGNYWTIRITQAAGSGEIPVANAMFRIGDTEYPIGSTINLTYSAAGADDDIIGQFYWDGTIVTGISCNSELGDDIFGTWSLESNQGGSWTNFIADIKPNNTANSRSSSILFYPIGSSGASSNSGWTFVFNQGGNADYYNITFQDWDGRIISTSSSKVGTKTINITPQIPTSHTQGSFKGWDPDLDVYVTRDRTYTAEYNPVGPTVATCRIGLVDFYLGGEIYWIEAGATAATAPILNVTNATRARHLRFAVYCNGSGSLTSDHSGTIFYTTATGNSVNNSMTLSAETVKLFDISYPGAYGDTILLTFLQNKGYFKFVLSDAASYDTTEYTFHTDGPTYFGSINTSYSSDTTPIDSNTIWTLANPTKQYYIFNGWFPRYVQPYDKSQTFIATWIEDSTPRYTIKFQDWDGRTIDERVYVQGEQVTVPSNPSRDGYEFIGWSPNVNTTAVANQTYTAQYNKIILPEVPTIMINGVEYNTAGGSVDLSFGSSGTNNEYQVIGQSFIPNNANYYLKQWSESGSYGDFTSWTLSSTQGSWQDITIKIPANEYDDRSSTVQIKFNNSNFLTVNVYQSGENNTFTITWKDYDGTVLKTEQVAYGSMPTPPTNPTRTGYKFIGWSSQVVSVTEDKTYTARYEKLYLQTFYLDDGVTLWREKWMELNSMIYSGSEDTTTKVAEPTKSGYTFSGWSPTLPHLVSKDQTHIAQFTYDGSDLPTYTVTWKDYDGTVLRTHEFQEGATLDHVPTPPERTDYTFTGWSPTPVSPVVANAIYTAQYVYNGSSQDVPTEIPTKPTIKIGNTTYDNDYNNFISDLYPGVGGRDIHVGWSFLPSNSISSWSNDIKYGSFIRKFLMSSEKGRWKEITMTLDNNEDSEGRNDYFNIKLDGSTFMAFLLQQAGGGTVTYYTIRFLDWDGRVISSDQYTYNQSPTIPANPTREGYSFTGWSPRVVNVTEDKDYIATYTNQTTTLGVTWDGETTYFSPTEGISHVYITWKGLSSDSTGIRIPLTTAAPSNSVGTYSYSEDTGSSTNSIVGIIPNSISAGATHIGFSVNNGSEGTVVKSYKIQDNGVYYYIHIHITRSQSDAYRIRFLDYDDRVIKDTMYLEGQAIILPTDSERNEAEYGRPGYRFTGWDPDDWAGQATTVLASKDQDYRATYTYDGLTRYTITFKDWDGTVLATQQVTEGHRPVTTGINPTREGYTFTGWDPPLEDANKDQIYTAQYIETSTIPTKPTIRVGGKNYYDGDNIILTGYEPSENWYIIGQSFIPDNSQYSSFSWTNTIKYGSMVGNWLMSSTAGSWQNIQMRLTQNKTTSPRTETFSVKLGTSSQLTWGFTVSQNAGSGGTPGGEDGPYTITFRDWDGTLISENTYAKGSTITVPTPPIRNGYTFTGWNPSVSSLATQDQTYIATYIEGEGVIIGEGEFLVRFLDWDGTIITAHRYNSGDTIIEPTPPIRNGYAFSGWYPALPTTCTKSADYVAQYAAKQVTVTFKSWDGAQLSSKVYQYGATIEIPTPPTRIHYKFTGWKPAVSELALSDVIYTAQYEYAEYTMTFIDWDGTVISSFTYTEGSIAAIPVPPERPGYKFLEWHLQSTDENGNMTYIAVYVETGLKIRFVSWDGTVISEHIYSYDDPVVIPEPPSRPGYEFDEWVPDVDPFVHEAKIYMASYRRIYTTKWNFTVDDVVQYSYEKTDVEKYFDQDYSKYEIVPSDGVKAGYLFQSWGGKSYELDEESKTKTWIFEGIFVQTGTIYRFYDEDQRTILQQLTYAGIGGSNYDSYVNPATPTKRNFKFTGWTLFKSEGNIYSYYAGWTPWGFKLNTRPNMSRNKYKYFLT